MEIDAVKVTFVPEQILPAGLLLIEMVGAADEFTVIVMELLTTVAGIAQTVEEVSKQVTTLPLANELVV